VKEIKVKTGDYMIHEVLNVELDYSKLNCEKTDYQPTLHVFVPNETEELEKYMPKRPTMLICPGGAYRYTSDRECEPIALFYLAKGYNCFILRYSCAPARFPVQLAEAAKALVMIKDNAEKWHVDTDKIFVCGFSAGGHLAASLGVFWDKPFLADIIGVESKKLRFAALVLSYPVLSYNVDRKTSGLVGSYKNLLGEGEKFEDAEAVEYQNLENHIGENTPPCFIWHTFEDASVPVETSMMFGIELRKHNIPMEMHIYEHGRHGQANGRRTTCLSDQRLADWMEISYSWLEEEHGLPQA